MPIRPLALHLPLSAAAGPPPCLKNPGCETVESVSPFEINRIQNGVKRFTETQKL